MSLKRDSAKGDGLGCCRWMRITVQRAESMSLGRMKGYLEGSVEVEFTAAGAKEIYPWVERLLEGRKYKRLGKAERDPVKRFLREISGSGRRG